MLEKCIRLFNLVKKGQVKVGRFVFFEDFGGIFRAQLVLVALLSQLKLFSIQTRRAAHRKPLYAFPSCGLLQAAAAEPSSHHGQAFRGHLPTGTSSLRENYTYTNTDKWKLPNDLRVWSAAGGRE